MASVCGIAQNEDFKVLTVSVIPNDKQPKTQWTGLVRVVLNSEQSRVLPLRAVFVVDISGSMSSDMVDLRMALKFILKCLQGSALPVEFGLVTFESHARVVIPCGKLPADLTGIESTIDGLKAGGGTNIAEGMYTGVKELCTPGAPLDCMPLLVLMTDGEDTHGAKAIDINSMVRRTVQNAHIISLGFRGNHEVDFLQVVATGHSFIEKDTKYVYLPIVAGIHW
jgi:Mg-chelatase subunit ChlD